MWHTVGMKRKFRHYFLPSWRNDYRPYILRAEMAGLAAVLVISLYGIAYVYDRVVIALHSRNVAAVVTSVLATLTNQDRAAQGVPGLRVSSVLQKAAQLKADDMVKRSYFAHTAPDGTEPWHWFDAVGYRYARAGENLAVFFSESEDVQKAWMNSPTHRANILNKDYDEVGIAVAYGTYQGYPTVFVVQEFGTPLVLREDTPDTATSTATTTEIVRPARTEISPAPPVVVKTPTFISVERKQNAATQVPKPERVLGATDIAKPPVTQSAVPPPATLPARSALTYAYLVIGFIVILAMMMVIFFEAERKHWRGVMYGVGVLALIVLVMYLDHAFTHWVLVA
ncbi:CAP domain-containing protein [bacterium]|nr:CAP domain-containing protein [bacterium]